MATYHVGSFAIELCEDRQHTKWPFTVSLHEDVQAQRATLFDKALTHLVVSKVLTVQGRLSLEARVSFEQMICKHPLGNIRQDQIGTLSAVADGHLKAMVDEHSRASLSSSCRTLQDAYKGLREIIVALVSPPVHGSDGASESGDEDVFEGPYFELMWMNPRENLHWKPFMRSSLRNPTSIIAGTWGVAVFSTVELAEPNVLSSDESWNFLNVVGLGIRQHPGYSACCVSGCILTSGGLEERDDNYEVSSRCWWAAPRCRHPGRSPGSLCHARYDHSCVTMGGRAFAIGGLTSDGDVSATVEVYDPKPGAWQVLPHRMRTARARCGAAAIKRTLFAFGGVDSSDRPLQSCECWTEGSTSGWVALGDAPSGGVCSAAAVQHPFERGNAMVYAVFQHSPSLWQYAQKTHAWIDLGRGSLPGRSPERCIVSLCVAPESSCCPTEKWITDQEDSATLGEFEVDL